MIELENMKVLIVDDSEGMRKSIRGMMMVLKYGSAFYFAEDGKEGWRILKEKAVDLIILDWNMPNMNGVELVGLIRDDRRLRDMPIVMVTAEANQEIVAEAAESDIDAYILKPAHHPVAGRQNQTRDRQGKQSCPHGITPEEGTGP